MRARPANQATVNLRSLAIGPAAGLGLLAVLAAAGLLTSGLERQLHDA